MSLQDDAERMRSEGVAKDSDMKHWVEGHHALINGRWRWVEGHWADDPREKWAVDEMDDWQRIEAARQMEHAVERRDEVERAARRRRYDSTPEWRE